MLATIIGILIVATVAVVAVQVFGWLVVKLLECLAWLLFDVLGVGEDA